MLTNDGVFYKSKIYLNFKPSTNLYNLVYFNRMDQYNQSMGSSDTWSDKYGQTR